MSIIAVAPIAAHRIGLLRRIYEASVAARARQAERELAPYFAMRDDPSADVATFYGL